MALATPPLIIRIQGENPFSSKSLEPLVGKRVSFEAFVNGTDAIVEKLSDVSVIVPSSNKLPRNNGPRP